MRRTSTTLAPLALLFVTLCLAAPPVVAEDPFDGGGPNCPTEFADRVDQALKHGTRWLLARGELVTLEETPVIHWGLVSGDQNYAGEKEQYHLPVGCNSLALYTLLKCGVASDHPLVEKGFAWLKLDHRIREEYDGWDGGSHRVCYRIGWASYEISAQILALTARHDPKQRTKETTSRRRRGKLKIKDRDDRDWLKELVHALVRRRGVGGKDDAGEARRGWRYNIIFETRGRDGGNRRVTRGDYVPPANQDLSSTQLAALALYSAHRFGVRVDSDVWGDIATFTLDCQEENGPEHTRHEPGTHKGGAAVKTDHARGFCYIKGSELRMEGIATGAMTACGVANLAMARDVLEESPRGKKLLKKDGLGDRIETAIHDGVAWLDLHWSPFANPPKEVEHFHVYYLYALERAMDLLGRELVGTHLWYREGAEELLKRSRGARVRGKRDVEDGAGRFWDTDTGLEPQDLLDTCFSLLFLRRATKDIAPAVTGG